MNSLSKTNPDSLATPANCYHCGELVPPGSAFSTHIDSVSQPMCCPGCASVAALIYDSGLGTFYRQRTTFNERPPTNFAQKRQEYAIYNDSAVAEQFSTTDDSGLCTAALLIGGITCAACTWLIEHTLQNMPGVEHAEVNLSLQRLNVRFSTQTVKMQDIFNSLADIGYRPMPYQQSTRRQEIQRESRQDLRRLAVAGLGMMQVGMFAIALHAGDLHGIDAKFQGLLRWVSLPVAGFVVWYSARPFFESAWRHLRLGVLVMDLPVALAIGLAFVASAWATISGTGQVYFDSVVMFTFFLLLGRFIEKRARLRTAFSWGDIEGQLPDAVSVKYEESWRSIPRISLAVGDTLLIRAGARIPADAQIITGQSAVSEDAFTGEPLPRPVSVGDFIYAGTLNLENNLQAIATKSFRDTRLATLARLVDAAIAEKPRLAVFADRMASKFVAFVLLVASGTALFWFYNAPDQALWIALSVLVISCPCALALATPAALSAATFSLRRRGVLARGENALETLSHCTHLLFDKTGTLTYGNLAIEEFLQLSGLTQSQALALCAALQQHSSHPMAYAFQRSEVAALHDIESVIGAGMEGHDKSRRYRMGNYAYCAQIAPNLIRPPTDDLLWVALVSDSEPLAWFGLSDELRAEAADVVRQVKSAGVSVALLTGDSSSRGPRLAAQLDMDDERHGQTPEQKLAYVRELQAAGGVVAMVGDGINDGPVLGGADVSIAVAGASDLARAHAGFVLLDSNLHKVNETLRIARKCNAVVKQNFGWAVLYNLSAIPLAAAGLVQPWAAAIGMSLSSLIVIANSLRLNKR